MSRCLDRLTLIARPAIMVAVHRSETLAHADAGLAMVGNMSREVIFRQDARSPQDANRVLAKLNDEFLPDTFRFDVRQRLLLCDFELQAGAIEGQYSGAQIERLGEGLRQEGKAGHWLRERIPIFAAEIAFEHVVAFEYGEQDYPVSAVIVESQPDGDYMIALEDLLRLRLSDFGITLRIYSEVRKYRVATFSFDQSGAWQSTDIQ